MKTLSRLRSKAQFLQEALNDLDSNAKQELDGDTNLDATEADIDIGIKEKPEVEEENDYGIKNISDQLDGMVKHWFDIAQDIEPNKKESFLKLGDRLSELSDVLKTEFIDG